MNKSSSNNPQPPTQDPSPQGFGPLAKSLAMIPSMLIAGSLSAQTTDSPAAAAPEGTTTDSKAPASDVVALPAVAVESTKKAEISSVKYTQPLVDTPQTIVVIPQKVYQEQGAKTLQDVLRNTPGISFTASENSGSLSAGNFQMRGTDASNSIFIDGIRDSGVYDRDIFNVEQVEVVKGPTGENGRAQAGGYVNLTTKAPRLDAFQEVSLSHQFDDYDGKPITRATYDINQPLDKSPITGTAFRLNALVQEGGIAGREVAENNKWSVAPSLAFGLGTPTRVILSYQHSEQRNIPDKGGPQALVDGPIPTGILIPNSVAGTTYTLPFTVFNPDGTVFLAAGPRPIAPGPGVLLPAGATLSVPVTLPDGTVIPAGTALPGPPGRPERDTFYGYKSDYEDINNDQFTTKLEHDFTPDVRLTNTTRYSSTSRVGFYSNPNAAISAPDLTTQTGGTNSSTIVPYYYNSRGTPSKQNDVTNRQFVNQTNFAFNLDTGPIEHSVTTGLELSREEQHTRLWTNPTVTFPGATATTPNPSNADATNPSYDVVITYDPIRNGYANGQTDTAALYAYDSIKLTPRWMLSTGGRIEHYQTDYSGKTGAAAAVHQETDDFLASYKAALSFKPRENGTIYTSYGNSFRPPGAAFALSAGATSADNPNLKPQEASNTEVGTKWTAFGGKLLGSFAIFKSENTNMPVSVTTPLGTTTEQTGSQEVEGWEAGLSGNITPAWLVFVGYAHQEGVYNTGQPTGVDAELAANPKESGNVWTSYEFPIGLSIGAGAQYFGESNRRQGSTFTVPAYTLYNTMASYRVTKKLSVQLNVNNVFDKLYIRGQNSGGGTAAISRIYLGDPRTYTVSATYRF